MSRIVSVWLPRWPILRALIAQKKKPSGEPVDPNRPFVLAVVAAGGPRIAALNEAAEAAGLAVGDPLADARAKAGFLQVRAVDDAAADAALNRLALWATRYTPTASRWNANNGADGFFLDIEGAAHLFGGEAKLLADLDARLQKSFGLPARLAVAATAGAAWALSHFADAHLPVLPAGQEAEALAPLPIEALRLRPDIRTTLRRLGFKTIGTLLDKPRAPFAARFPGELLQRLDQALGRRDEPLDPVIAPPVYHSLRYLLEPIFTQDAVVAHATRLMQTLVHVLLRDAVGARSLRLCLYGVDGAVETLDIGLTLPTRSVAHVARLIALKLEALAATPDAGFGFEAIGLAVTRAELMPARQTELNINCHPARHDNTERYAALVDALRQRLGPHRVRQFAARASHLPERAEALPPLTSAAPARTSPAWTSPAWTSPAWTSPAWASPAWASPAWASPAWASPEWTSPEQNARPLLLLPRAEPAEDVMAIIPEGPPRRFRWRGVTYDVAGAQGPERIAGEWWRAPPSSFPPPARQGQKPTRDYYLVEDTGGHRFWLFREGLYGRETTDARWFVHGLFA